MLLHLSQPFFPFLRIGTGDFGTLPCVTQPTVVEYFVMCAYVVTRTLETNSFLAMMFTYLCCPCVRMDSNKTHVFNNKTMKARVRPSDLHSASGGTRTIPENRHSPCTDFFGADVHISVLPLR